MKSSTLRARLRSISIGIGALALVASFATTPATASTTNKGLFGSPNEFASVQLQSQALLGLVSARVAPSPNAVNWLLDQQCDNGAFQGYRADTAVPCADSDPVNFSGPSADQTAWALMALAAVGEEAPAKKAAKWLISIAQAQPNGTLGIPSYAGGTPDANSSGLSLSALNGMGTSRSTAMKIQRFLGSLVTPCGDTRGGAARYQPAVPGANNSATAQAYFGITTSIPVYSPPAKSGIPKCGKNATNKLGSYLAQQITQDSLLTYYPYDGNDYGDTALTIVAFSGKAIAKQAISKGTAALKANAREWALKDGVPNAGALGSLLLVSVATDSNPKNFGGINLIAEITKSETK